MSDQYDSTNIDESKSIDKSLDLVLNDIRPKKEFAEISDNKISDNQEHIFNERYYENFEVQIETIFNEILSDSLQEKDFYIFKKNVNNFGNEYDEDSINDYISRSEIYKKHPIKYLQFIQNSLEFSSDKIDIAKVENYAIKQLKEHFVSLAKARAYLLPYQLFLGIIFLFIKNKLGSRSKFNDFLYENPITNKSEQTIRNYMKLASLLKYDWFERYIHTDLTNLYTLYDVIERTNDFEKQIFFKFTDPIVQCINDLSASSNTPATISDYSLVLSYYIRLKNDFKELKLDRNLYYRLYLLQYKFTASDIKFIRKWSYKQVFNTKSVYLADKNFINEYFEKLLEFGKNRDKAQLVIDSYKSSQINKTVNNEVKSDSTQISIPTVASISSNITQPTKNQISKVDSTPKSETSNLKLISPYQNPKVEVFSNILTKFDEACTKFIADNKLIKQYDYDLIQQIKIKLGIIEQRKPK